MLMASKLSDTYFFGGGGGQRNWKMAHKQNMVKPAILEIRVCNVSMLKSNEGDLETIDKV